MSFIRLLTWATRGRPAFAALPATLLVLAALVAPAAADTGHASLDDPTVTPRAASPATTITFAVTYRSEAGAAPDHVSVVIDGSARLMAPIDGSTDYQAGVAYRLVTKLPAGAHVISFVSAGVEGPGDSVAAGTVRIFAPIPGHGSGIGPMGGGTSGGVDGIGTIGGDGANPTPGPTPDNGQAPGPTPGPGAGGGGNAPKPSTGPTDGTGSDAPRPTAGPPSGTGRGSGGNPAGGPTAGHHRTGTDPGTSGGGHQVDGSAAPGAADHAAAGGASTPTDRNTDAAGSLGIVSSGSLGGGGGSGGTSSGIPRELTWSGQGLPPILRIALVAVSTTGTTTAAMAFFLFGKRRRDGEPPAPDEVLSASAASGMTVPSADLVPAHATNPGAMPAPNSAEVGMPRWRRPSLLEARKSDPLRSAAVSVHQSFEQGVVAPLEGVERRQIRYRVVRLLDAPDEFRAAEIGVLDQGDEVQLLERSGAYWLVLCPDGGRGWVHKMTLGDVVDDGPEDADEHEPGDDILSSFRSFRSA